MQLRLCLSIAARCPFKPRVLRLDRRGYGLSGSYLQYSTLSNPVDDRSSNHVRKISDSWSGEGGRPKRVRLPGIKIEGSAQSESWERLPPLVLLARYLHIQGAKGKEPVRQIIVDTTGCRLSPPLALLLHLARLSTNTRCIGIHWAGFTQYLEERHLTAADLDSWGHILYGKQPDEMIRRFCVATTQVPSFILLQILKKDLMEVESLQLVLRWVWEMVDEPDRTSNRPHNDLSLNSTTNPVATSAQPQVGKQPLSRFLHTGSTLHLELHVLALLISQLIYHGRRLWPAALTSISRLVPLLLQAVLATTHRDPRKLHLNDFRECCDLLNKSMQQFAVPSPIEPYKSMNYNWTAQKTLLQMAKQFEPSLVLDRASYRSILQVLAALRKTNVESKAATLRSPAWPPWRVHQDGIDAQRSPEDDWSRVVRATMQLKEAGYNGDWYEEAMKVIGGQDNDGTPTIQHRKIIRPSLCESDQNTDTKFNAVYWAQRIVATRNVEEAWSAFLQFKKNGGLPDHTMYLAMFEKLNYNNARLGRKPNYKYNAAPGDGKEVLPVPDANYSEAHRLHHQPPSMEVLYKEMIRAEIQPAGELLRFLLRHARSLDDGFQFLDDSDVTPQVVQYLRFGPGLDADAETISSIPVKLLAAVIELLCRFAPRCFPIPVGNTGTTTLDGDGRATYEAHPSPPQWHILENSRSHVVKNGLQPLQHAVSLLHLAQPGYRPAWYALFKVLARDDIVLSRELVGKPENHFLAWQVLMAAFDDFHRCGLQLDPYGFLLICSGYQAYVAASYSSELSRLAATEASKILKAEFKRLSATTDGSYHMNKLLHPIRHVQLHNYIRCMGLVGDFDEIIGTLRWMSKYHEELDKNSAEDRNGYRQLRRALVAVRFFCAGTEYLLPARETVEAVESWGGWVRDEEMEEYLNWQHKPENHGYAPFVD